MNNFLTKNNGNGKHDSLTCKEAVSSSAVWFNALTRTITSKGNGKAARDDSRPPTIAFVHLWKCYHPQEQEESLIMTYGNNFRSNYERDMSLKWKITHYSPTQKSGKKKTTVSITFVYAYFFIFANGRGCVSRHLFQEQKRTDYSRSLDEDEQTQRRHKANKQRMNNSAQISFWDNGPEKNGN
ncbi:hypothetical protein Ddc_02130 [Ditylenchus destructor]|nr:hypothetical protein Ddc_02130 [Ditylenchus destructor]